MRWDFQWRENIPLALPVIVGQIGHIAASVADSMMVGALGTIPLAAVSLASSIASVPLLQKKNLSAKQRDVSCSAN